MPQFFFPEKRLAILEIVIITGLACVPLFATFPYRVNIFLSWEGAYRISQGQLPFRDFGIPMGGMFWVIPALFFKIFGAKMITLVKAQVFINIISGLAFRSILKSCHAQPGIRFISVVLYCLSFSFFNFWPWYNHTVIVYQFVGLAFLLKYISSEKRKSGIFWLLAAALFTCFSFLTKQDAGGMAFIISLVLLGYHWYAEKKWQPLVWYAFFFTLFLFLIIAPFLKYSFNYWFNHGQPPHTARVSVFEILDEFLGASLWLKFYLFLILFILILKYRKWKDLLLDKPKFLFLLLTICILGEAAVFQVTSYTPPDNNIFFHSFAIAFILTLLSQLWPADFNKSKFIVTGFLGIVIWWSGTYWNYFQRIIQRAFPQEEAVVSKTGENIVNRKTYMKSADTSLVPANEWAYSNLKSFDRIYMPKSTVEGMKRLLNLSIVKNKKGLKVLNMTELTPLAVEIPYKQETGENIPLWYHLGVAMFNKQAKMYEDRIIHNEYDLVLFEFIPSLNNFFPFRVRDSLQIHYNKIDSFNAPRRGSAGGYIEVYTKKIP